MRKAHTGKLMKFSYILIFSKASDQRLLKIGEKKTRQDPSTLQYNEKMIAWLPLTMLKILGMIQT